LTNYPNLNFDVGLDIPFSLKPHPFLPFLTATFVGLFSFGSLAGQPLSSSLQLNPKKLTGFYFAMPSSDFDFFGAEAPNQGAIRSTMSEFAENSEGLQLVFISNDSNVAKFNELKSSSLSKNAHLYKGFFGIGSQTQIGKVLVQNFKVSVLPTLLICNNSDRILDANGLSSLKSKSDPYAYWKSLDTTINPTAISKPAPQKTVTSVSSTKRPIEDEINKLKVRKTESIKSIAKTVSDLLKKLGSEGSTSPKLLSNASTGVDVWLDYSRKCQTYTKSIRESLSTRIEEQKRADDEDDEVFSSLLKVKMSQQHAELVKLEEAFSEILILRAAFRTLFVKCAKYNDNIDVLGQKTISELIERDIGNFQQTHLNPLLNKQQNQSPPK